jgi:hypothetical protein
MRCYPKKHKHFHLSQVREGQRSVVNSVKPAVVVSLILHHQRCDNFHKTLQKNAKWTGDVILCGASLPLCPLGPPLKRVLHICETKGTVSTAKWMVFGPVDVAHYEKFL